MIMRVAVLETMKQERPVRSEGTHMWGLESGVVNAIFRPVMAKNKSGTIKIITVQHAVFESYQGVMIRLKNGLLSISIFFVISPVFMFF